LSLQRVEFASATQLNWPRPKSAILLFGHHLDVGHLTAITTALITAVSVLFSMTDDNMQTGVCKYYIGRIGDLSFLTATAAAAVRVQFALRASFSFLTDRLSYLLTNRLRQVVFPGSLTIS